MESIRIQADAVIVTPQLIHVPGQIVLRHGRIVECTRRQADKADIELPGKILSPALLNAHTHLEFSDLPAPLPAGESFPQWIRSVVERRRHLVAQAADEAEFERGRASSIRLGLAEAWRTGSAVVADIVTRPWLPHYLTSPPKLNTLGEPNSASELNSNPVSASFAIAKHLLGFPQVIALAEILGLDAARCDESANWALQVTSEIASAPATATDELIGQTCLGTGLSPHSPYSLDFNRLRIALASQPVQRRLTAMHVAESREERAWLEQGSGPFRSAFEALGVPLTAPRPSILDVIDWLTTRTRALLIHGNYLQAPEMERVASAAGMSVVYCPRTHRHFGHSTYPLRELLAAGVNVVLATDSRASNPDLSLWSEVNAAREEHHWLSPAWLFGAVTTAAATSLGIDHDYGSLLPGHRAAINVCSYSPGVRAVEILDELTTRVNPFRPLAAVLNAQ